jgi:hypothetical protein
VRVRGIGTRGHYIRIASESEQSPDVSIFAFTDSVPNPYAGAAMWYVNKLFDQAAVESLSAKGFLVRNSGGVVRIEKYDCGAELRKTPEGRFQMTEIPCIMMLGQFTTLWDAGYQKFLISHEGKKFPVHVRQLGDLRQFNEELRTALGVPTYYNEALGSTCAYSVYDRVKGRPGDVPDESVGAHEEVEH